MYSFGGVPGSVGRNQLWSAGLAYTRGPFSAAAAYLNARNPNLSFYGTNPNAGTTPASNNIGSAGSATTPQSNPIYAGYASASTVQIIGAGTAYTVGPATIGATYSNVQFRGLGNTGASGPNPFGYSGNVTFNVGEANLKFQITPSLLTGIALSYAHSSGVEGRAGATYKQGSLGVDYFLSKRTDLYSIIVYQHASGTDSLNQPAVAAIAGQTFPLLQVTRLLCEWGSATNSREFHCSARGVRAGFSEFTPPRNYRQSSLTLGSTSTVVCILSSSTQRSEKSSDWRGFPRFTTLDCQHSLCARPSVCHREHRSRTRAQASRDGGRHNKLTCKRRSRHTNLHGHCRSFDIPLQFFVHDVKDVGDSWVLDGGVRALRKVPRRAARATDCFEHERQVHAINFETRGLKSTAFRVEPPLKRLDEAMGERLFMAGSTHPASLPERCY